MTPHLPANPAKIDPALVQSPLRLSLREVERLLTEDTPDVRIDVLKGVAESHNRSKFNEREQMIAEQIFRVLMKDTEISVRETLAAMIKDNPSIPRDIILSLARDADPVALPIIECSQVLTDADLAAVIKVAQQSAKPVAAARRAQVSPALTQALMETRNGRAVLQLVKNENATIPDETYQQLLREHRQNAEMMTALAQRPNLPVTVVEKVITLVSGAVADTLRTQYNISGATIAAEAEKTRELATLRLVDGKTAARDVEKLIDQLHVFGRLSPSIILTSLCRGNLLFFETALARLSSIPLKNAQLLIRDKAGFKALYSKAGLPDKFFQAATLLLDVVTGFERGGREHAGVEYANLLVQELIARSLGQPVENLSYIIALIRQNA